MKKLWKTGLIGLLAMLLQTCAFAANPATGDQTGKWMWIMVGLLGVSVVLIVVYVILSIRKKK